MGIGCCTIGGSRWSLSFGQVWGPSNLCSHLIQYRCLGLCIVQSTTSHTGQCICGSSSGKQIGLVVGILSAIPGELPWGVDDIETASIDVVLVVTTGVVVTVLVPSGIVSHSLCEVGGPLFNTGTCSTMTSGSLLSSSHWSEYCSFVGGIFCSFGGNCLGVDSLSSST